MVREYNFTDTLNNTIKSLGLSIDSSDFSYDFNREKDGLSILRSGENVKVSCSEQVYLFRALGLLKENEDRDNFCIEENASFISNGIMLDCSFNGVVNIHTVKNIIKQLALMGLNTLMLYTEDTYEVEGHPYFGYMRGRYSIEELRDLDDYAYSYGIEIIPCIQTLGHMDKLLRWKRTYDEISDTAKVLLIGEEKTYKFIEEMVLACRKAFRSNRIHIGMDETHDVGRGKYYDINGDSKKTEIFNEHLEKVEKICSKHNFRPMMWGDMLLRFAGCTGYTDCDISVENLDLNYHIDDNIDYIYWDYYSIKPERYSEFIRAHKKLSNNVVFFGGGWRWSNFSPSMSHSITSSVNGLNECKKNGIKEAIVTLWSSPSNESSTFAAWPIVQLYAECNFYDIDDVDLAKRFKTCTGGNIDAFYALENMNRPCGKIGDTAEDNPLKYMFYQDPLLGLYDYYVKEGFNEHYSQCAEEMHKFAQQEERYRYIFEAAEALCLVMADKAELGIQIKKAYDDKNREELKRLSDEVIPRIINNLEEFRSCFEKQWMKEFKIFSYEVMDIRFGGLVNRLNTAQKRLNSYLNGDMDVIEELTVEKLPYDGQEKDIVLGYFWNEIVTTSSI